MKRLLLFLLAPLLFIGCKEDPNLLYLYNWTYYLPEQLIEEFEQETGIEIRIANFASNEEMFSKVIAGGLKGFDLIVPTSDYTEIMIKLDLLEEINHDNIPNLKYLNSLVKEKAVYDHDQKWSVPYYMGASGIAVNTKLISDYPRDWSIFADPRFKKKSSLLDDMREVMGAALMSLGYSGNSTDPKELDEATDLIINEWKPNIVKFDAESFGKSFARGEFAIVHCYIENVFEELSDEAKKNVDFFIPEEGGMMAIDNFVIPKGAKHKENAEKFINFFLEPEHFAVFLDEFGYPNTCNTEAQNYMTTTPYMDVDDMKNSEIISDIAEHLDLYNSRWEEIKYGN